MYKISYYIVMTYLTANVEKFLEIIQPKFQRHSSSNDHVLSNRQMLDIKNGSRMYHLIIEFKKL